MLINILYQPAIRILISMMSMTTQESEMDGMENSEVIDTINDVSKDNNIRGVQWVANYRKVLPQIQGCLKVRFNPVFYHPCSNYSKAARYHQAVCFLSTMFLRATSEAIIHEHPVIEEDLSVINPIFGLII